MPTIQMQLKVQGLTELLGKWQRAPMLAAQGMDKAVRTATLMTQEAIREQTPVRTGYLKANILASFQPGMGIIRSYAKYGIFVHEGTAAHVITPVNKKALYWKGARHPVRVVHHPGTKGKPFMTLGVQAAEQPVNRVFQQTVNGLLKQLT